jgi:hypothetical protein
MTFIRKGGTDKCHLSGHFLYAVKELGTRLLLVRLNYGDVMRSKNDESQNQYP